MRNLFVIIMMIPMIAWAQVRVAKPVPKMLEDCPYDSTKNYVKKEQIRCLIGQELQVLPLQDYNQRDGYRYIVKGNKKLPDILSSIEYNELLGKVLLCTDAFSREKYGLYDYYLELKDNSNGDTYYYKFSELKEKFYFLVLGYKDKFEHDNRGQMFIFKGAALRLHDFNTGEQVVTEPKQQYIFQEMIFNAKDNELGYLFTDEQSHLLCFDEFHIKHHLIKKSDVDQYVARYGQSAINAALEGGYYVGMPVELLKLSWGKPNTINRTSYSTQYVYDLSRGRIKCFYIENGKVTGWN